jgi:hypothetical protein
VLAHQGIAAASIPLAFDYRNMVVAYPQLYGRNLGAASAIEKVGEISSRLSALPGVDGVTEAVAPPLGGRVTLESQSGVRISANAVAPSYFKVMSLPLVRGRLFLAGEPGTAMVSESAARALWPNQDPVGKIFDLQGSRRTVAGVVKDSGANLLVDVDSVEAYVPIEGAMAERAAVILHSRGDVAPQMRLVPGAVAAVGETVSVTSMRAARENFLEGQQRLVMCISSIGVVATALAAAGMFALVAFAVAQRKRELGIRIAIGARPLDILRTLLTQHARPTAAGAVVGAILAAILTRVVRSLAVLRGTDGIDIAGFGAGLACFLLVALLATLSPASRALRIDPSRTLREE